MKIWTTAGLVWRSWHGRGLHRLILLPLLILAVVFFVDYLYNPQQFPIRDIVVRGQFDRIDSAQVLSTVEQFLTDNYFTVKLPQIEMRVEQLPWVFNASVRRRWPDTLFIDVVQKQPVAQWGEHQWLNASGDLVDKETVSFEQELPLLSAPDEQKGAVWQTFLRWETWFATNGLHLDKLKLTPQGLWYLTVSTPMHESIDIIVRQQNADRRIEQFCKIFSDQVITKSSYIRSIDLRYPNGFTVAWKDSISESCCVGLAQ